MNKLIKTTLGQLATYINGRGFKPFEWTTTGLPIVRIANLNSPNAPLDYYEGDIEDGHRINNGDILVSWSATLDAFVWNNGSAVLNQHIFKVIPNEDRVDIDFLFFVLKRAMQGLSDLVHGATMKHVNRPVFEKFEVWIPRDIIVQRQIATKLKAQLEELEKARKSAEVQVGEIQNLANSIIKESIQFNNTRSYKLAEVLHEIKKGIGESWKDYPVLGATRNGLAPAKEPPGKTPQRYKPVVPSTVFYNPMRILIGSIAFVDDDDVPGITSPDYVVLQGEEGLLDSRWFYYWLRSPLGEQCINSLARGAVRERMLFNRLAEGEIELPEFSIQKKASESLKELVNIKKVIKKQMDDIKVIPNKLLAQAFKIE